MKKIFLLIITLTFTLMKVNAQRPDPLGTKQPVFYAGLSTGVNGFTSRIGLETNLRIRRKLFIRAGVGTGSWGVKYSAGIKYNMIYDMRFRGGWSYSLSYSQSNGMNDVDVEVRIDSSTYRSIKVNKLTANAINFSTIYNFKWRKTTLFLEFGYSFVLQEQPWTVLSSQALRLPKAYESAIKAGQGGGWILGTGINWSLF